MHLSAHCSADKSFPNSRRYPALSVDDGPVKVLSLSTDFSLALPPLPRLEISRPTISPPSQRAVDPLQHQIVNFDPLVEGDLAQGLIDGFWQVDARMDDGWPLSLLPDRASRAGGV
jgi:hypothetical protein